MNLSRPYHVKGIVCAALLLPVLLLSCAKHNCRTQNIDGVAIHKSMPLGDTVVRITRYPRGSNFTAPVDSVVLVGAPDFDSMRRNISYSFEDRNMDYTVTLLPSGVTHRISELTDGNEKSKGGGIGEIEVTTCSFTWKLDGVVQKLGSHHGSGTGSSDLLVIP